jgi:hypothetical protein
VLCLIISTRIPLVSTLCVSLRPNACVVCLSLPCLACRSYVMITIWTCNPRFSSPMYTQVLCNASERFTELLNSLIGGEHRETEDPSVHVSLVQEGPCIRLLPFLAMHTRCRADAAGVRRLFERLIVKAIESKS